MDTIALGDQCPHRGLAHFCDQLLDSSKPGARVVRMDRADSAGMASVPGLQQRQHLAAANLADAGADRGGYARGRVGMRPVQELFRDERAPAPLAPREKPPRRARGTGIDVLDRGVAGDGALAFPQIEPAGRLVGVETRGSKRSLPSHRDQGGGCSRNIGRYSR